MAGGRRNRDSFWMSYYNDDRQLDLAFLKSISMFLFQVNDDRQYATGSSDGFRNECDMRTHLR